MSKPLIKWPGGKRWLARDISMMIPRNFNRLIEPFAGGAALFFFLEPHVAILNDKNPELINCYRVVKYHTEDVIQELAGFRNSPEAYLDVRRWRPKSDVERAARFLYLTRLSFNGIYRENMQGEFNVPYGRKAHLSVCDTELIIEASQLLRGTTFRCEDFEAVVNVAGPNDLLYVDPPYTVAHNNNGFVKYNSQIFDWNDQVRLARSAEQAVARGATVFVSNAAHESVAALYPRFHHHLLKRHSVVGSRAAYRKPTEELLMISSER